MQSILAQTAAMAIVAPQSSDSQCSGVPLGGALPSDEQRPIHPALLSLIAAGLSFAYFLTYPLALGRADESHLLHGAKRVLDGQAIYKDFFAILTPLSYCLFAAIYRIGGTTLLTARVGMAVINAVGCGLLFHLTRRVSGTLEAMVVALMFAVLCIPAWPFASPHWVSTTLGLLVATVTLSERWRESVRARPLVAGILSGIAVCVQQQRGVLLAAWLPLALWVLAYSLPHATRRRTLAAEIALAVGATGLLTAAVIGYTVWTSSPAAVFYALYEFPTKHYPSAGVAWAGALPLTDTWREATWPWLLRISPLFLVGEGVLLLSGGWRARRRSELERVCLWLLAALMALAVSYLPDFIHVSFALPFLLIPGAVLLHTLRCAPLWDRLPAGRLAVTAGIWLCALALAAKAVTNVTAAYAAAPARFETGFGVIRGDAEMERLFRAVRSRLVREPDGSSLLYSYPDDSWLYLALPAEDATRFSLLAPPMFPSEDIQEAIAALRARRPGTVVLLLPFSWVPVGRDVGAAIAEGYDAVEDVGQYRIFVRRQPGAPPAPATPE